MGVLRVGTGRAVLPLTEDCFPTVELFAGQRDENVVRALLLEQDARCLIVSVEQTSLMPSVLRALREEVIRVSSLPSNSIWICATHTFSVPHIFEDTSERLKTDSDRAKNRAMRDALVWAAGEAVEQAVRTLRPASLRVGTAVCNVNVNRDIQTQDGWWLGACEEGPSNRTVTTLRFDGTDGSPVAVLFHYDVQSSVMHHVSDENGNFYMSGDLAGSACRYIETELQSPAIFLCGACGDQAPYFQGMYEIPMGDGTARTVYHTLEDGFRMTEWQGQKLGQAALRASYTAVEVEAGSLTQADIRFTCPAQRLRPISELRPTRDYDFEPDGETDMGIELIHIGQVALIGIAAEPTFPLAQALRERSGQKHTLLCSMVNGAAKYLADSEAYDQCRYAAMNSRFARGTGEQMVTNALALLKVF